MSPLDPLETLVFRDRRNLFGPPTVLGRLTENLTKPMVVWTRKRAKPLPEVHDLLGVVIDHAAGEGTGAVRGHDHPVADLD
jgi:hypothetical protein